MRLHREVHILGLQFRLFLYLFTIILMDNIFIGICSLFHDNWPYEFVMFDIPVNKVQGSHFVQFFYWIHPSYLNSKQAGIGSKLLRCSKHVFFKTWWIYNSITFITGGCDTSKNRVTGTGILTYTTIYEILADRLVMNIHYILLSPSLQYQKANNNLNKLYRGIPVSPVQWQHLQKRSIIKYTSN